MPLIIAGPGLAAGQVRSELVGIVDLAPTILTGRAFQLTLVKRPIALLSAWKPRSLISRWSGWGFRADCRF